MARYYTPTDWIAALIAFLAAFIVYLLTLAPTITLESSGQFVVAADHLGVARVPGYPLWHLSAFGFNALYPWATYHGYPNPAWNINLMSAFFGAMSCAVIALILSRMARHLIPNPPEHKRRHAGRLGFAVAFSAALLFAFSPTMWSQSVIAETHAL